ncbi:MAG: hypothetical protein ACSHX8_06220 [Opitutaceae bacterium]
MNHKLYLIKEKFPHYSRQEKEFPQRNYYAFTDERSEVIYEKMLDQLNDALVGKYWFPVIRIGHAHFSLCLGTKPRANVGLLGRLRFYLHKLLKISGFVPAIAYGKPLQKANEVGVSKERLNAGDVRKAKTIWLKSMQQLTRAGLVAGNFHDRADSEDRVRPLLKFSDENDILFTPENFAPLFGIYAFMCGPDFEAFISEKNIAVVTWINEERKTGIESTLIAAGASSVEFIPVSAEQAVFESIDPNCLDQVPDIALFACGLGSAPLMVAFKETNTVCIDCGFVLDVFAHQKELRGKRAWTLPDHLYDEYQKYKTEK